MAEKGCISNNAQKEAVRVACLYRVSTTKQVDHNEQNQADIPVQRKACHEFCGRMGWSIVIEEQEDGVSGFKVSASDRDKIQLLKEYLTTIMLQNTIYRIEYNGILFGFLRLLCLFSARIST